MAGMDSVSPPAEEPRVSSRLRRIVFDRYDDHYLRANAFPDLSLEQACRAYGPYYEALYGPVVERVPAGGAILDVGCGVGLLFHWLHGRHPGRFRLEGVDHSARQLARARANLPGEIALHHSEARAFLAGRHRTYDLVFCEGLLEHVPGDDEVLDLCLDVGRSLKPEGTFVCRVPNMANLLAAYYRYSDITHGRGFTSFSMRQLLDAADFREIAFFEAPPSHLTQRVRLSFERLLHRVLFRICGVANQPFLSGNLTAICRAPVHAPPQS
jgi:2-polyprenyl-3-methyl-5-hydroxy-6-metoxy-1,4-benzoquinol methylase